MVHLTGQLTGQLARPFRRVATSPGRAAQTLHDAADDLLARGAALRLPAVRRELDAAESGDLLVTGTPSGGTVRIEWQRHGRPAITLDGPYRLDRVDLKGSHRARLYGLTAGVRLVCPEWSPLFLIAPAQLPVLACAAAASRMVPVR
ncbi:hypothetical protein AB0442_08795 [Kitasatospora sp. NPDC085895]|uniref:hypothetical protein n=1 Tax=Kitasatospora sp. NPDC085895 TaxID=3155057 RepID=UPI0034506A66